MKARKAKPSPKDFSVSTNDLIGKWFVSLDHLPPFNEDGTRIGFVISTPEPLWYLVEIFSFKCVECNPRCQVLVHITNLSGCRFFVNSEDAKNFRVAVTPPKGLPEPG